jgi:hypothetical protein
MSLLYLWLPDQHIAADAPGRFAAMLDAQRAGLVDAFGHPFTVHVAQNGRLLIGLITWDIGVTGHRAWSKPDPDGLAWAGVPERDDPEAQSADASARAVAAAVLDDAPDVHRWSGRFAACAWRPAEGRTVLATGGQDAPSLWEVTGAGGWAAGSRSAPLFDLAGQVPALDLDQARLYVAYGYLIGERNLLGATRIPSGRRLVIDRDGEIRRTAPVSLADVVGERRPVPEAQLIEQASTMLLGRVRRQLARSEHPLHMLSGGRDSRVIAAALARAGFHGPSLTGGGPASRDARAGRRAAEALRFRPAPEDPQETSAEHHGVPSLERATAFVALGEGLQTLRQGTSMARFFRGQRPIPVERHQVFHGLGGEIARGYYYLGRGLDRPAASGRPLDVLAAKGHGPWSPAQLRPWLAAATADFDAGLAGLHASTADWLDLYYWQRRCLHWGADLMALSDLVSWHWAPFMDRVWVRTALALPIERKGSNAFVEALAVALAPGLAGVPYESSSGRRWMLAGMGRRSQQVVRRLAGGHATTAGTRLAALWRQILLDRPDPGWADVLEPSRVRRLVEQDPGSDAIWNLATVELVRRAFVP